MSVADLKSRLADVPGIQNLTMQLQAGRIILTWADGYSASADASASDSEIETAIRNAIKLPPVALIPDKPAVTASAPAPASQSTGKPMSVNPDDTMNALDRVMSDHVALMGDIHAAQLKILEATLARQRDTVAGGVGSMARSIDAQTDRFAAMMAKYTNGGPA